MGNKHSTFTTAVNDVTSRVSAKHFTTVVQVNNQAQVLNQSITLNILGTINCGNVVLTNSSNVSVTGLSVMTTIQKEDLSSVALQAYADAAQAQIDIMNEEQNLPPDTTSVKKIMTEIASETDIAIKDVIKSTITQNATIDQRIVLTISKDATVDVSGSCTFSNDATINMMASNVVEAVSSAVASNSLTQELEEKYAQLYPVPKKTSTTVIAVSIVAVVAVIIVVAVVVVVVRKRKR